MGSNNESCEVPNIIESDKPRICVIGAGFSGICTGVQLQQKLGINDFIIFDQNAEVGGAWFQNTYPGLECDVPSHLYSFSFAPNPNWSKMFSPQREILEYLKNVSKTYKLYKCIKFNHQVTRAVWDEMNDKWTITILNKLNGIVSEMDFDIVISGVGLLNKPNLPEQFKSFKGPSMHTAEWKSSIQLEGKRVGVVGNGASAVQLIPSIVDKVEKLVVFHRTPTWILPRIQFEVPSWMKGLFQHFPIAQTALRASFFFLYEGFSWAFIQGARLNKIMARLGINKLNSEIEKKTLEESLLPNFTLGCKRPTFSESYYTAIQKPNVEMIFEKIEQVTNDSIITEDLVEHKLDVLILATGFKVQEFFSPMQIYGIDKVDILELWKDKGCSAYLGICTHNLPNFFFVLGPNGAVGSNSYIFSIEMHVQWIMQVIGEFIRRKSHKVVVDSNEEAEYMLVMLDKLKPTVWNTNECKSWYKNQKGIVTTMNAFTGIGYWRLTRKPDFNKLIFT